VAKIEAALQSSRPDTYHQLGTCKDLETDTSHVSPDVATSRVEHVVESRVIELQVRPVKEVAHGIAVVR
jgi:hypothetical protein